MNTQLTNPIPDADFVQPFEQGGAAAAGERLIRMVLLGGFLAVLGVEIWLVIQMFLMF
ncbi:MAG: hypothetical protein WBR18_07640 [Anaerolineales bacterium]